MLRSDAMLDDLYICEERNKIQNEAEAELSSALLMVSRAEKR